ncbi:MAG TPA: DNA polymerase III subunit chi [Paracoccaceae bacterium]|nr:DNA polymerase III subunit chi [Paracoccaceae bacterium]HMO70757.1 DNA polymerase III subunit chi [Paracoccaceae bacterium]
MGLALFYHLTRSTAEATVRVLASRALAQGWRVMVRGTEATRLARLDAWLWTAEPADFLPHGVEGGPHDADQPLLIGQGPAANAAQALLLLDGALASDDEARGMERVWILFDGADDTAVEAARGEWRRLAALDVPAQYWTEDGGKWVKKMERAAPSPGA